MIPQNNQPHHPPKVISLGSGLGPLPANLPTFGSAAVSAQVPTFGSAAVPAKDKNSTMPTSHFTQQPPVAVSAFPPAPAFKFGNPEYKAYAYSAADEKRKTADNHYALDHYLEAFLCYNEVVKINDTEYKAAYRMGLMLYEGKGVQVDYKKAYDWFLYAVKGNYNKAYAKLGDCCYYGNGTAQNYPTAFKLYKKGVDSGDVDAYKGLGMINYYGKTGTTDYRAAFQNYFSAATTSDQESQFQLALCYHYGHGVDGNRHQAVSWYTKAALQGHITAAYNAAVLYHDGLDDTTPPNYEKAFYYYQKAAEKGYADAMCNLGYLYEKGYGVETDYSKAFEWYKKASHEGSHQATQNLGELYMKGLGTDKDLRLALKCFQKAKEGGIVESEEYIQQVESMKNSVFRNNPPIDQHTRELQEEVLTLKGQLKKLQNESQELLDKKDKKITILLEQMKAQHDQINRLIFQMASNN